jgi:transposase
MTDYACDTHAVRQQIQRQGAVPNIPPKRNRPWKDYFSPFPCLGRNAVERMFCCRKDFRRVATRYDRLATNLLAAVHLAAIVGYWL